MNITIRKLHKWTGITLAILILTISVTGIFLNHEKVFFRKGGEKGFKEVVFKKKGDLNPHFPFDTLPVSVEKAVAVALSTGMNGKLDKIEIKGEFGEIIYKVKFAGRKNNEVIVSAKTGKVLHIFANQPEKVIKDLHTGKFFGWKGISDFVGIVLICLCMSGFYMWWVKPRRLNINNKEEII